MRDPIERYFVYILRCSDGSYYTGISNNPEERLKEHEQGMDPKCYTYKRRPVELLYRYGFREVNDAIAAEKQIKGWSRRKKEALIEGKFGLLPGLSENARQRRVKSIQNRTKKCISTDVGVVLRMHEA